MQTNFPFMNKASQVPMQVGSRKWNHLIEQGAKEFNVSLDQKKIELLGRHAIELLHWNQKINLTAITDPVKIAVNHFLDSIAPASMIPPDASLLDVGSGGGFPGIPLKILIPSLSVALIDSSRKKISFLKHVIRTLGLHNIGAHHVRAEDIAKDTISTHTYDVIISRALSSTDIFIRMALPLLSKDGIIMVMKGKLSHKDIESVHTFLKKIDKNFSLVLKKYRLPHLKSERSLMVLRNTN